MTRNKAPFLHRLPQSRASTISGSRTILPWSNHTLHLALGPRPLSDSVSLCVQRRQCSSVCLSQLCDRRKGCPALGTAVHRLCWSTYPSPSPEAAGKEYFSVTPKCAHQRSLLARLRRSGDFSFLPQLWRRASTGRDGSCGCLAALWVLPHKL